jgi:predicted transcriptional regulator
MGTTKEYRGRREIIAQILQIASDNGSNAVTKTSIMYKSFLSYAQLKEYLSFLVENGLLEEFPQQVRSSRNKKSINKITQKGLRLLHICNEIGSLVDLDEIS